MKKNPLRKRIDHLLVERGLALSGSKAQALIMAGVVKADGRQITKAGHIVDETAELTLDSPPHPYVSRGGVKLESALKHFKIDVTNKICLDAGASTGGFTHCLLLSGASLVYAVDVGYGQLDFSLRNDSRVICIERCNVRYLTSERVPENADIITADLSFISLEKVLKVLKGFLKKDGVIITLIKPQFEAERGATRKGVVRDDEIRMRTVEKIIRFAETIGLQCMGFIPSPIKGPSGNTEFLACFQMNAQFES